MLPIYYSNEVKMDQRYLAIFQRVFCFSSITKDIFIGFRIFY